MSPARKKVAAKKRKKPAVRPAASRSAGMKKVAGKVKARAKPKPKPKLALSLPAVPIEAPVEAVPVPVPGKTFPIEVDATAIEDSLKKVREELLHWAKKGRYTRVRFKFRGKQLLPDLPLAAVVAAEGLSFYWAGILRALLANFATGALLSVELVNDADKKIAEGREALLGGDADKALELFRRAAAMDRDNASAQLNLGVVLKLRGETLGARAALQRAVELDPEGVTGQEAQRVLNTLGEKGDRLLFHEK